MKWTTERPTEPGFYFFRSPLRERRIVKVVVDDYTGALIVSGECVFNEVSNFLPECEWAGPIPEP